MPAVRYLVDDVDAALVFYRALGFKQEERWGPPFAIVTRKGLRVWLSGPGSSARQPLADGALPAPGGWNRLVVEVKNLDKAIAKLSGKGAQFRSQPIAGPGGRQVLLADPSGNLVELFEPERKLE